MHLTSIKISTKIRNRLVLLAIGAVTIFISIFFTVDVFFNSMTVLQRLNNIVYDTSFRFFHKTHQSNNIVLIDLDEKSLKNEGKWPWPRNKFAALIQSLKDSGVAVIALDLLFPESDINIAHALINYKNEHPKIPPQMLQYLSQNHDYFDNDKILAETINGTNVIMGVFFNNNLDYSAGKLAKPILAGVNFANLTIPHFSHYLTSIAPLTNASNHSAFVNVIIDDDGVLRRSPTIADYKNNIYPSLALEASRLYLMIDRFSIDDYYTPNGQQVLLGINLGNIHIPTDYNGNVLVPFIGPAFSFPVISATDVLHKNFSPQTLKDKLIIIGSSSAGIADIHTTPTHSVTYPGYEVHATVAEAIINKTFLSSPIWLAGVERTIILTTSVLLEILFLFYGTLGVVFVSIVGLELLIFLIQAFMWGKYGLVLPHMILPYSQILFLGFLNLGYGYLFEIKHRKKMRDIYGQYVSTTHIDRMLDNPQQYTLDGKYKLMTVLFCDVRNFTTISEKLGVVKIKKFLNELLTPVTEIVFNNRGTIDKYVGDMVMAFWNDPIDDNNHPQNAVRAGLQIIAKVKEMAPEFSKLGLTNVAVGVGINSGYMNVGDMGSKYRKAYTVIGDSVNLASRLESANKFYGTSILVSQKTKDMSPDVAFRFIDSVFVKGKETATEVFEPICFISQITLQLEEELKKYEMALKLYRGQQWDQAKTILEELTKTYPHPIYLRYITRIESFKSSPPPADWDGTYKLTEK